MAGNQVPSGFKGRILIAIAIALVGLFTYMYQTEVNPVTGEKQHVALSPDQEIRLGLESAPQMSREMGGEVPPSDPYYKEVKRIGDLLLTTPQARKSPWQFEFHLLADRDTVNAFALPGGQIFITMGLLTKLQNEAQLAGVLAHEMGHVIERHTAEQMAKNQLGQWMIVAVSTGAASDQYSQGGQNSPAMIAAMVNQIIQLRYSRQDESEADVWGLKLMEQVGYNPDQMIAVMKILKEAGGSRGATPSIFQTHPDPDLRIEQIQSYLKSNPPRPGLTNGRPLKEAVGEPRRQSEWFLPLRQS